MQLSVDNILQCHIVCEQLVLGPVATYRFALQNALVLYSNHFVKYLHLMSTLLLFSHYIDQCWERSYTLLVFINVYATISN